ncbi:EamA family transporter [Candidatus Dojkabacteria bacterium]|nr:EamA family transporter [Candidatus Dojkabacteria bacterium]
MWILFTFAAAISRTLTNIFGKFGLKSSNEYISAIFLHIFKAILILPLVLILGIPVLTTNFWISNLAFLFLTPLSSILFMKALKDSPLSVSQPMMAFNPIFTALLNHFFKREPIDTSGWLGIILISLGLYLINFKISMLKKSIFEPLKYLLKDKGAQAMLGVAFIWSLSAHFGKMRIEGSNLVFSIFISGLIGVLSTASIFILKKRNSSKIERIKIKNVKGLSLIGFANFLDSVSSNLALQYGPVPYASAIKRSGIVLSVLAGKYIFKEDLNWLKLFSILIIFVGIVLIIL